jgi:hypothetical protein
LEFRNQVEEVVIRLFGVIRDSHKLKEMSWDPEKTAELYYQISEGFVDSPDLRITWLENLSSYLAKVRIQGEVSIEVISIQNKNYEESAQVKILTAAIVGGYLKLLNKFPYDVMGLFLLV